MKTKEQLIEDLRQRGVKRECGVSGITTKLVRFIEDGTPIVGVASDLPYSAQVHAIIDALYWWDLNQFDPGKSLKIAYTTGPRLDEVLEAVATLLAAYNRTRNQPARIEIEVDFKPAVLSSPDFSNSGGRWVEALEQREEADPPPLVSSLSDLLKDEPSFRWYRSVTANRWSGRVEGLEVCRIEGEAATGMLNVGRPGIRGDESKERLAFKKTVGEKEGSFDHSNLPLVANKIRDLAKEREGGDLKKDKDEHHLEAQVLRKEMRVKVITKNQPVILEPVCKEKPFQFPTLWSLNGKARYVDVLMRDGEVPYVVELKDGPATRGQYYRHAITQVVLYREFIRKALPMHPWFRRQGLDASRCQAVVAFPSRRETDWNLLLSLAERFEVEAVELC